DRKAAGQAAAVAEALAGLVPTLPALPMTAAGSEDLAAVRTADGVLGAAREEGAARFVDKAAAAVERALRSGGAADGLGDTAPEGDDAPGLLLVGLVRSGVRVTARPLRDLVCDRVLTAEQADAAKDAVAALDEDRVRLDAAVKADDGFFT